MWTILDILEIENQVFLSKERTAVFFNFNPFVVPTGLGESSTKLNGYINEVRRYYNEKSFLDPKSIEKILDLFRYCIRRDFVLLRTERQEVTNNLLEDSSVGPNLPVAPSI